VVLAPLTWPDRTTVALIFRPSCSTRSGWSIMFLMNMFRKATPT
jgi:hypothetical protein